MFLTLNNISVRHQKKSVVERLNFTMDDEELICVLGPSGCGKSSMLRAIAGLNRISAGEIYLDGQLMASERVHVPPQKRKIGMVFQDYALFPHLTVMQNIMFGLHEWSHKDAKKRVDELLELVGLNEFHRRYPHTLSGGEQQRVALARALAPKPRLLLLDEPLSSLDSERRQQLAGELKGILTEEHIPAIFVTHDQLEAFSVTDRLAIMRGGKIQQLASSYEIYHNPISEFVAGFVGQGLFIKVDVIDEYQVNSIFGVLSSDEPLSKPPGKPAYLLMRPDDVIHDDESQTMAVVEQKMFRGSHFLYKVRMPDDQQLFCLASSHHNHPVGEAIGIRPEIDHLVLF